MSIAMAGNKLNISNDNMAKGWKGVKKGCQRVNMIREFDTK